VAESLAPGAAAAAAGKAAGPPSTEKAPKGQCMAELTVVRPNGAEQRFELRFGGVVCIGRGGKSDVSSDFSGVSLRHVELFLQPAASDELGPPRLFARDCSKNGTGVRQAAGPEDGGAARGFVRVMPDTPCAMGQGSQILVPMRSRKGDVQKPEEERTFTLRVAFPAATALSSVSTAEEEADRAGPMEPVAASVAAAAAESPVAPQPTPAVLEEQGPDQQENRDAAGGHKERWQRKRKKKEKEKQQLAASGVEVEVEELRKQPKDTKPPEAQSSESARTAQARREEELLIDAEIAEELARTARPKRKGRGRRELREDGYEAPILVAEQALEEAGVAVEAPITDAGEVSDHSGTVVPDSLFDKIDQNHDGVISREELAGAMRRGIVREADASCIQESAVFQAAEFPPPTLPHVATEDASASSEEDEQAASTPPGTALATPSRAVGQVGGPVAAQGGGPAEPGPRLTKAALDAAATAAAEAGEPERDFLVTRSELGSVSPISTPGVALKRKKREKGGIRAREESPQDPFMPGHGRVKTKKRKSDCGAPKDGVAARAAAAAATLASVDAATGAQLASEHPERKRPSPSRWNPRRSLSPAAVPQTAPDLTAELGTPQQRSAAMQKRARLAPAPGRDVGAAGSVDGAPAAAAPDGRDSSGAGGSPERWNPSVPTGGEGVGQRGPSRGATRNKRRCRLEERSCDRPRGGRSLGRSRRRR